MKLNVHQRIYIYIRILNIYEQIYTLDVTYICALKNYGKVLDCTQMHIAKIINCFIDEDTSMSTASTSDV